ncbi:tRNA wybutosine-synthesizing protein 3 homolog isoform X2 [Sylvia atricapilla]|uniref:tRNA wybutosine-synthesizing protein 3 homolog isoform X2 n=1 Tax=Sylvia atricapilla TaxID=48155 RepID=UPI0033933952
MAAFARRKAQRLALPDPSRKRALDARAAELVRLLNARERFCTTSSCDGRVTVTMTALEKATGDVVFKFEPFVLHVLCRELQDAQLLHSVAIDSGFRNSGITVGRGGKITMAVRSTHCLEVPLSHKGRLMVSEEYIEFLVHVANQKMEENIRRIERFHKGLELALETADPADAVFPQGPEKGHSVYVHRRKRRTAQEQAHPSRELGAQDETENSLDLFAEITI